MLFALAIKTINRVNFEIKNFVSYLRKTEENGGRLNGSGSTYSKFNLLKKLKTLE